MSRLGLGTAKRDIYGNHITNSQLPATFNCLYKICIRVHELTLIADVVNTILFYSDKYIEHMKNATESLVMEFFTICKTF